MAMSKIEEVLDLKVFTQKEYQILKAAMDRIVPEAGVVHDMDLARMIDSVLAEVRRELGQEMKRLLYILEYGTTILGFKWKRFTQMTPEEQDGYLASWEKSRFGLRRMGFQALKRAALAAFYGSQQSWPGIRYRGPWLERGYPHYYSGKGIQTPD